MKYHTLFFLKIRKDVTNVSSAAVVIGVIRVKHIFADITEDFQLTSKDNGPRLEQSVLGPNFLQLWIPQQVTAETLQAT